ncbi:MAG: hypothetical protein GY862_12910 [Gammaproteobacteria bacterium]|nr:hypothetical protein [Gammaproteobacteria bacterium]
MKYKMVLRVFLSITVLAANQATADSIAKPYTFTAGASAKASEVNANFDTVYEQVNKTGSVIDVDATNRSVDIGTNEQSATLTIHGPDAAYPDGKALLIHANGASNLYDQIGITSSLSSGYGIAFSGQGHHRGGIYAINKGGGASAEGEIHVWARSGGNIILDGKVGIGTAAPEVKLNVLGGQIRVGDTKTGGNPVISLASSLGNNVSAKGKTIHRIFGPYDALDGNPGALYISTGRSADGSKNNVILYNYACQEGCNVPKIQLNADTTHMTGNVGIGTSDPKATLDIKGYAKLEKQGAAPDSCDADHDGAIALASTYRMCVCKSGTGWVFTTDGATACVWQ